MDIHVPDSTVLAFVEDNEDVSGERWTRNLAAAYLAWRGNSSEWGGLAIPERPEYWNEPITIPPGANHPEHWIVRFTEGDRDQAT